jgi:hypothetical protein
VEVRLGDSILEIAEFDSTDEMGEIAPNYRRDWNFTVTILTCCGRTMKRSYVTLVHGVEA